MEESFSKVWALSNYEDSDASLECKHVLNVEVLDNIKSAIPGRFPKIVSRIRKSKLHSVLSDFKLHFSVVKQRDRRVPIHVLVENEFKKLIEEGHIKKLNSCSEQYYISPIIITVKRDESIKL